MATQMTPKAKKFIRILAVIGIVGGVVFYLKTTGKLDRLFKKSVTVEGIDMPDNPKTASGAGVTFLGLPETSVSNKPATLGKMTINQMEWNGGRAIIYAQRWF